MGEGPWSGFESNTGEGTVHDEEDNIEQEKCYGYAVEPGSLVGDCSKLAYAPKGYTRDY